MSDYSIAAIAALNDTLRRSFTGGMVAISAGIQALTIQRRVAILLSVRTFDDFDPGNNPHGEHDFGAFEYGGDQVFWKIDYYDRTLTYGSPDPSDPSVTLRVLTIMLAEEY